MMKEIQLPYCDLIFKEFYAIMVMHQDSAITVQVAQEITTLLDEHYKGKEFVLITNRKYPHAIDLSVYKGKILKNMIGFAIVSHDPNEIKRALQEQPLWNEAFTFFKELSEAENWARSFFD